MAQALWIMFYLAYPFLFFAFLLLNDSAESRIHTCRGDTVFAQVSYCPAPHVHVHVSLIFVVDVGDDDAIGNVWSQRNLVDLIKDQKGKYFSST